MRPPAGDEVAVVLGASGGIGRALVEQLRQDRRYGHLVAISRRRPEGLADGGDVTWVAADILDSASLAAAAARIADLGPAARIIVATGALHGPGLAPEKSLQAIESAGLVRAFEINAVGPALAAKHLLPCTPRDRPAVFAALSARVGSIGDNASGGWYGYRSSKAALNMIIRTAAVEYARSHAQGVCVAIHPGTVATPLSAPFTARRPGAQLFTPSVAAGHILKVLDSLNPSDTGRFFAWDGAPIPW